VFLFVVVWRSWDDNPLPRATPRSSSYDTGAPAPIGPYTPTPAATPRQHARQPDTPAPTTPERFEPGYKWRVSKDSDETVSTAEGLRRLRKIYNSPEVERQVDEMMQGIPNWRSMTPMERVEAQMRRDGKLD